MLPAAREPSRWVREIYKRTPVCKVFEQRTTFYGTLILFRPDEWSLSLPCNLVKDVPLLCAIYSWIPNCALAEPMALYNAACEQSLD